MAYIRWKRNKSGLARAQLVHSYRGPDGKPRQRILAHLGEETDLSPERLAALRSQYPELKLDSLKPPSSHPHKTPLMLPESISNEELWQRMGELRRSRGWDLRKMVAKLTEAGLLPVGGGITFGLRLHATPLRWTYYRRLEKFAAEGKALPRVAQEILPFLKKLFTQPAVVPSN